MSTDEFVQRAIYETVEIVPYDPRWPVEYGVERDRLLRMFPAAFSGIEHVGSTAVPGLAAKPIIDLIVAVPSMEVADVVMHSLVDIGYLFSADFNIKLGDSRWMMKHSNGRRTHHLHMVLPGSSNWLDKIRFRDLLRADAGLAAKYLSLKKDLAQRYSQDREAYTEAKADFVRNALA